MTTDDCAWIANRIAADFYIIAEHRSELLDAGFDLLCPIMDNNQLLITFHVARDAASAHVAVIAKDAVADIVIMRRLHMIKKDLNSPSYFCSNIFDAKP